MNEDDFDLIENLLLLSVKARNIPLDKLRSYTVCFYQNEFAIDDFLDANSYPYQAALLEADIKKIKAILNNFDKAIETQCNNFNIDLSGLKFSDPFQYSCRINSDERKASKRYLLKNITPSDPELFKKYWLLYFIKDCKKIAYIIRDILGLPKKVRTEKINVSELLKATHQKESEIEEKARVISQSSKSKEFILQDYYTNILPQSIANIDNLFYWLEKMEADFETNLGYLDDELHSLKEILIRNRKKHNTSFKTAYQKILPKDKEVFLNSYHSAIKELKFERALENKKLSNYTVLLEERIKTLQSDLNKQDTPKFKNKSTKEKLKYNSFTLIDYNNNESKLTDLRSSLIKIKMISEDTTLKDFRKVFS
ncbi:MAG: hypothetical protein KDC67_11210, partial [Ignavibacteriae bacterium]|nr:hypothetical protein [Ignavibacteriota bacterium]